MEKLTFSTGIRTFQVNDSGAVLRLNPSDSNLYSRFFTAMDELAALEDELTAQGSTLPDNAEEATRAALALLADIDRRAKAILNEALGCGNDLDAIFEGQNCMALADNGERLLTNFIAAITPIIQQGALCLADARAEAAVAARAVRQAQP
ncbi:MAG: hypothetical protein ACI4OI_02390 [Gemmiger sp.]